MLGAHCGLGVAAAWYRAIGVAAGGNAFVRRGRGGGEGVAGACNCVGHSINAPGGTIMAAPSGIPRAAHQVLSELHSHSHPHDEPTACQMRHNHVQASGYTYFAPHIPLTPRHSTRSTTSARFLLNPHAAVGLQAATHSQLGRRPPARRALIGWL